MKICCHCKIQLELNSFSKSKNRKDGLSPVCKNCNKEYRNKNKHILAIKKKQYAAQPHIKEKYKKYKEKYYLENKEYFLNKRKEYYSQIENRKKILFWKSKERAEKEGIEHSIKLEDIEMTEFCPYLGLKLTHELREGQLETNSSLDRIDSKKGYIPGNIQIISRLANTMKNNASIEQLLIFAKNIIRLHDTKKD